MPDRQLEMERRAATAAVNKLPKLLKEHATALQENTEEVKKLTDAINEHLSMEAVRKNFRL